MKTAILIAGIAGALLSQSAQCCIVPAWTASQQATWGSDFLFPTNIPSVLKNRTLRQVVRMGIGGRDVRIALSNAYGSRSTSISGANLALSAGEGRTLPASNHALRFGGDAAVTIAPGATILSDPVPMTVAAGQDMAVSLYFAENPVIESFH